jgi:hypothetical protein
MAGDKRGVAGVRDGTIVRYSMIGAMAGILAIMPGEHRSHEGGAQSPDAYRRHETKSLTLEFSNFGLDTSELLMDIGALFEGDGSNCPSSVGLFYITKKGIRLAFPARATRHSLSNTQDTERKFVRLGVESDDCRYEIDVKRLRKDGARWQPDAPLQYKPH